jgi:hypothetical protein
MDERTGHLIEVAQGQEMPPGYTPIPPELEAAAQAALAGKSKVYIDPTHTGPMPQYLRDRQRMMQKRKARRRRKRKARR